MPHAKELRDAIAHSGTDNWMPLLEYLEPYLLEVTDGILCKAPTSYTKLVGQVRLPCCCCLLLLLAAACCCLLLPALMLCPCLGAGGAGQRQGL